METILDAAAFDRAYCWAMAHASACAGQWTAAQGYFRRVTGSDQAAWAEYCTARAAGRSAPVPPLMAAPDFARAVWLRRWLENDPAAEQFPDRDAALAAMEPVELRGLAAEAVYGGRPQAALTCIAALDLDRSDDAEVLSSVALLLIWVGEMEWACRLARRAHTLAPGAAKTLLALANCLAIEGDFPAARALVEPAAGRHGQDARVHSLLGTLALAEGDLGLAARALAAAEQLDRPFAVSWLGMLHFVQGGYEAALSLQHEAMAGPSGGPHVLANMAVCLAALGRRDEALAARREFRRDHARIVSVLHRFRPYAAAIEDDLDAALAAAGETFAG